MADSQQLRRSLAIGRELKRDFRKRCESLGMQMSDVLTALVLGWARNRYRIDTPDPVSETLYVPHPTYEVLRSGAEAAPARTSMRVVLEQLILGWLAGRYRPRVVSTSQAQAPGNGRGEVEP